MRKRRVHRLKTKLAVLCAAGTLFQTVQCTRSTDQLGVDLFQSITSVFITDYINNLFNVTPGFF